MTQSAAFVECAHTGLHRTQTIDDPHILAATTIFADGGTMRQL
jgi:hypothetical protein